MSDEVKVAEATVETKTRKNHAWDDASKDFVRTNAASLTDIEGAKQLAAKLGKAVSVSSYRKIRQDLKIKKLPGRGVSRVAGAPVVEEKKVEEAAPKAALPF